MAEGVGVRGAWTRVNEGFEGVGELLKVQEGVRRRTLRLKTVV